VAELILTEQDANKAFDLHVGDRVPIQLAENPTTGYRWNVEYVDENLVSLDSSEFSQTPGSGVGGGGTRTITVRARSPGVTRVSLKNQRVWEPNATPVGQFEVTFNIAHLDLR
jgi:inhibitor of cysteine peptidase